MMQKIELKVEAKILKYSVKFEMFTTNFIIVSANHE